ncbi:putative receptor-like protein kinase [Hibiscus syriacus]|uniref:non-specific serine/threonine protein kinase n=1 Tax=Hibiscus syriacus TaxID=106335 RepID=A0A6A2WKK7_HIBSY|nr:putative receptor-like protein kinase [Hibiscus syriacus]
MLLLHGCLFANGVWQIVGVVALFIIIILSLLPFCLTSRKRKSRARNKLPLSQIPSISKEIKEVRVEKVLTNDFAPRDGILLTIHDKSSDKDSDKVMVHLGMGKSRNGGDNSSQSGSFHHFEKDGAGSQSGDEGSSGTVTVYRVSSSYHITAPPLVSLPEFSHLGWGHWFTLRDLELATNRFSKENILGEGGYGVVYRGNLINGTQVAVKKILNNLYGVMWYYFLVPESCLAKLLIIFFVGAKQREFRVEVEAIGHVRHKNLDVVYEYVNNGNLEQWLHGATRQHGYLTWEDRVKILLGTTKANILIDDDFNSKVSDFGLAKLSSNILIDDDFNSKVSDFGLAKLLGAGKSHVTTRVMGTFGYVAPEYANTGLLNEKSDDYSFGVVNLVDWLKMMVGNRRSEEVVDPNFEVRPSTRALKRTLLTALRCVDPDSEKRPKISQVARMLESEEYPIPREDRRHRRTHGNSVEIDSQRENSDTDKSDCAASRR